MPLIYDLERNDTTRIAVWENTEKEDFFIRELQLTAVELSHLKELKAHRIQEWLTSRYLCYLLDGKKERKQIIKDQYNKPHLENSNKYISISHSKNRAAVIISNRLVGIDVQRFEPKITRIQHKFISVQEHEKIDPQSLEASYHIFWGAKECMYKAYGKREIEFKDHMHLYPFSYHMSQIELKGWLRKNEVDQNYIIYVNKIDDYYLVYSILEDV
jgi:phosphopantetheinyl transferase